MDLDSVWLKFSRALQHLKAIQNSIAQDIAGYGDRFTIEADGKETLDLIDPNPVISVQAGEFVYQVRSALDHLAFDLVKMNRGGIILPIKWDENCMFPIWSNLRKGQTIPLPYGGFESLPGIPIEAHTIIEKAQPYYPPGTGSVNTHLMLLNKLSNIDKHRRFALTRARAKVRQRIVYKNGFLGESLHTLDHGAEIPTPYAGESDSIVNVETSTSLTIAFNEREALGDASGVPIDYLLESILSDVWGEIVSPIRKSLS
jgi:hypothetical protein